MIQHFHASIISNALPRRELSWNGLFHRVPISWRSRLGMNGVVSNGWNENRAGICLRLLVGVLLAGYFVAATGAADFTTEQWCAVEIPLTSSISYTDPFDDVDVTATFTGPGGQVIVRPAFWDGTNTWRVRFAPTVTGQWSMVTACSDPTNSSLGGITNTIECNSYTGPYAIYQHGFLKVSPNGRYFVYADGTPFFYLGDTHWLYIHERFETSNVPNVSSEFEYTVNKRVAEGFTVFQSEAIQIPQGGIQTNANEEPYANLTNGFSAAALPGFWNIDQKFAYIASNGLVHANGIITWALEPLQYPVYTQSYMAKLGRYWAARYGAYPVLWTVAQEIDPNVYNAYNTNTIGLWYAAARAVSTNDGYGHPLGPHMQSNGNGINSPADSWWSSQPYHKFWAMQLQPTLSAAMVPYVESFWTNVPTKPMVLYEEPYEDFWTDTDGVRSDAYIGFQWGMCGFGYGANGVWNDLYDYSTSDWGTAYYMPGSYLKWFDGANLPGGEQLTYLKEFYNALDWWNLTPRFNDPAWGDFADPNDTFLSSESNTTYVVYFDGANTNTGTLMEMEPGIPYDVSWFNPSTGVYTDLGGVMSTAGQWTIPALPSANDWVLLARQKPSAIFPSPANGSVVSLPLSQVSWAGMGLSSNLLYSVYFGRASDYNPSQPHGNLACIAPAGGTTNLFAELPEPLEPGVNYDWMLSVADPAAGTTNYYSWSFAIAATAAGVIPVSDPSFETPGALSGSSGWAYIADAWNPAGASQYQQNELGSPGAHFTQTSPNGGAWYALMNANTVSISQDLQTIVAAGSTISLTFYGGRGLASSSTADGGVFTAAFVVGSTPYSEQVNTTDLTNDSWQSYTLTRIITNSGDLSLEFSAVSGDPWLDNVSVSNIPAASPPVFSVTVTNPADGEEFLASSAITASATVANGLGPYVVTYYTNAVGKTPVVAGLASSPPYEVGLGTLAPGIYQICATVLDSALPAPNSSTSMTLTFTIASAATIPVPDGSFETTGGLSSSPGWASLAGIWKAASYSEYQENNLTNFPGEHFTTISPGGGVWYTLLNSNTVSISQDLLTNVNIGDTLSMTFYAGRGRDGSSTSDGGVFEAAFLVGATAYAMPVDTTALAENSWQSFTLTQTITNSGDLHVEFSVVRGDPWLDNISNISLAYPRPVFTGIGVAGTTLTLKAKGGIPNGPWTLLQSTDVALPLNQWTPCLTGSYDDNGNLSTNLINTVTNPREFFIQK